MHVSEEYKETPEKRLVREQTEREQKAAIFLREHQAAATVHVLGQSGINPGPAGPGPTQSNDTPGADSGDGLKA